MKFNVKNNLVKLILAALFIALDIVVTRLFSVYLLFPSEKLSVQPLVYMFAGYIIGPWYSIAAFTVSDVLGMMLLPQGQSYLWPFTIVAVIRAAYYGFAFYKRPVNIWYSAAVITAGMVAIEILLNPFIMSLLFDKAYKIILISKLLFKSPFIPVYIFAFYAVIKALKKLPEFQNLIKRE